MALAKEKGVEIVLPIDFVTSSKFGEDGEVGTSTKAEGIPDGYGLSPLPRYNPIRFSIRR